jgi:hypothetical protein
LFVSEAVLLVTWMCVDHSMIDHTFYIAKYSNLFSRNLISPVTNMSDLHHAQQFNFNGQATKVAP